jgi:FkbM family methyltransferase
MVIYANDFIGIQINQFGVFEREQLELMFEFLAPLNEIFEAGVAIDAGANIGNHTLLFARHFTAVESFEPNPETSQLLDLNTRHLDNVRCHRIGLGDAHQFLEMSRDVTNAGGATISLDRNIRNADCTVEVDCLDNINIEGEVCLIKIDVEGFEYRVLRGAAATIKENQPLILLEQRKNEFIEGASSTPALQFLADKGYIFCWHEVALRSDSRLIKRLVNLYEFFAGRKLSIVHGARVPVAEHDMILAIPQRFHSKLIRQR